MKAPNITPGEWWAEDAVIWHSGGDVVAVTETHADKLGFDPRKLTENQKADTVFIAAAPKMAEALDDLTAAFETLWRITCKELPNDTLEAAKSALLAAGYTE